MSSPQSEALVTRNDVIAAIVEFAGPLGPLQTLEEFYARRDTWLRSGGSALRQRLLELIATPPEDGELQQVEREDFEIQLVESLGQSGREEPEAMLAGLAPLLERPETRPLALDVIAALGHSAGVPLIRTALALPKMNDDEVVRAIGALGEIGGEEARQLLVSLKATLAGAPDEVKRELDIALQAAQV